MNYYRLKMLAAMEWMKLASRLNIVFLSAFFLLIGLQIAFLMQVEIGEGIHSYSAAMLYQYAGKYVDSMGLTGLPVLLLINMAREFEYGIVHRSLVSGISRKEYFTGKMFQLLLFGWFSFLMSLAFTLLTAALYQIPLEWNWEKSVMYFPATLCLGSFSLMVVLLLKKTSYSMVIFIGYVLLENIFNAFMTSKHINLVLPFNACAKLLKPGMYDIYECMVVAISTIVTLGISYCTMRRTDLR